MATNRDHAGQRLSMAFSVAHNAGDFVWEKGFFGVVPDAVSAADVTAGNLKTLILCDVWTLARTPATVAMGVVLAAPATAIATTLPLLAYSAAAATNGVVPGGATAGWYPIGRTTATGGATTGKVQLFNPNPF